MKSQVFYMSYAGLSPTFQVAGHMELVGGVPSGEAASS